MRRLRSSFNPSCRQTLCRWRGTVSSLDLACRGEAQDRPKRLPGPKVPHNHLAPWAVPRKPFLAPSVLGLGWKGQPTWLHPSLGSGLSCQKAFPRAFSPTTCSDKHDPQRSPPKCSSTPFGKEPRCRLSRGAKLNPACQIPGSFLVSSPERGWVIPAMPLI